MKNLLILAVFLPAVFAAQTGYTGVGSTAPTATLHVKDNMGYHIMRVEDATSTDTNNYVVKSADAVGTFKKVETNVFRSSVVFPLPSTGVTIDTAYPTYQNTKISITVPPGYWNISGSIGLMLSSYSISSTNIFAYNCRLTLADTDVSVTPSNDVVANYTADTSTYGPAFMFGKIVTPAQMDFLVGYLVVNNSTTAPKTYYLLGNIEKLNGGTANFINFGSSSQPENQLYAQPINNN